MSSKRPLDAPIRSQHAATSSGSWRVRVYAGINPTTRRPRYVSETVPDGPDALLEVEDVRQRLLAVCRSHGQGNANVAELINRHILLLAISETTRQRYFELASTHVVPMIHCRQRAAHVGTALSDDSFLFSANSDGLAPRRPDTVTGWYRRLVRKLGIATSWHKLRHFNATELISAGVDVRTVAGRLGHADGGTTLKYYAAWVREADQRASAALARLLPLASQLNHRSGTSPDMANGPGRPATYASIADDLRGKIATGQLPCGATVPSTGDLSTTYRVAPSTAHRAIAQLAHERLVVTKSGHRTIVAPRAVADSQAGDDTSSYGEQRLDDLDEPFA